MKYLPFILALLVLPAVAFAQDTGFVPLTNVPFLTETGNAFSLDSFLNGLYRLCIGIAAVVAVLQIMRAGIMYMGGDSVTEKKEAKNLIALSIGGLILVLSPVVVFSLINPEILSLKIGNIDQLKVNLAQQNIDNTLWVDTSSSRNDARARCEAQGGTPLYTCTPPGGSARTVEFTQACNAGEDGVTVCRKEGGATGQSCPTFSQYAVSESGVCNGANGFTKVENSCAQQCASLPEGQACCGRNLTTGEMYAWKGVFYTNSSCITSTCAANVLRGGAYASKAQCEREFTSATQGKVMKTSLECSCDFKIGEQGAGQCLSDTSIYNPPADGTGGIPNPPGPQTFKIGLETLQSAGACVEYTTYTLPDLDACIVKYAEVGRELSERQASYVVVKQCNSNELQQHRFKSLPTCS